VQVLRTLVSHHDQREGLEEVQEEIP
jgi:hypothetical protein